MEEAEGSPEETEDTKKKGTSIKIRLKRTSKKFHVIQKLQKGYLLPPESVKILRDWISKNWFNAYPTETDIQKLSKETNLSDLQISNWFTNARRSLLSEILQNLDNISYNGQDANAVQTQYSNPSMEVKAQRNATPKMQDLSLLICQESRKNLPYLESFPSQKVTLEAKNNKEDRNLISGPLSSPELVWPEEKPDFSNFYMLVDAAVQKAAEMEEQKKENPNP